MCMQMTQQANFSPADLSIYVTFEQSIVICSMNNILMPFMCLIKPLDDFHIMPHIE